MVCLSICQFVCMIMQIDLLKTQKMGLGPTQVPLNFESDLADHVE